MLMATALCARESSHPRCYHWRHMQDRIRALVVVDDADVRSLLTGVLTRSQMTVVEARAARVLEVDIKDFVALPATPENSVR